MINVTKADLPPIEKYFECLKKIWANRWLTNDGEFVQLLGKRLEDYLKVKNLVLMSNGTLTLQTALKALDIKGEVITTPFTFAATTNVLLWEGLTPVFADINPETYNIDPVDVEKKITNKTTAILPVHVYGNPCYVNQLREIADKHNLKIVYDAAHAFGVEYKNQPITDFGDVSTLSFHATKVFNTIEGGAVVAKDEKIVEKLKLMRNHGIKSEEEVVLPGTNAKMNEFQAAMGLCNLENIDEAIRLRRTLYEYYIETLSSIKNIQFQKIIASKYNYGYMPILLASKKERDSVYSLLLKNDIKSRKYFFPLTTNFDYFKKAGLNLVEKYKLINADSVANRVLCLPLYPDLKVSAVDKITSLIKEVLCC
ncbi:MAG: DegT/DnrJ/EryC1/StrS family aminotransferase [Candidatus Bathyarchaeia archaeon]|jgi:dTDP-4-amino-4,6-dideoxygalactose transaminase